MTQEEFLVLAREGKNIFLTGPAGSGKTYILNKYKEEAKGKTVIVAPTGIAAVNCGGATIHKTFKITPNQYYNTPPQDIDWCNVKLLIIDEVFMVSVLLFNFMDRIIRKSTNTDKLFGGIQTIIVGDKSQLPPVYNLNNTEQKNEYNYSINKYGGITIDCSDLFKEFTVCELSELKRSSDDKLNNIVNNIRAGNLGIISKLQSNPTPQFYNSALHIFWSNADVDNYNYEQLLKHPGKQLKLKAKISGVFNIKNTLADEELNLKPGCRTLVIRNTGSLVNGDQGTFIEFLEGNLKIKVDRFGDTIFTIDRETWEEKEYTDGELSVVGTFKQYPIKLGYALTIHKTQGLTLDKIIFHYKKGMTKELIYVAVSRATTYDGIYIIT